MISGLRDLLPRSATPRPTPPTPAETVEPPRVIWPEAGSDDHLALACPNCGAAGEKPLLLTVRSRVIGEAERARRVVACPACAARFYDDQKPADYAEPAMLERGRVPFYVQQGAGLSLITRPLARLPHAPGAAYLEVGCGYGFGVDFAARARGWAASGIDPAALSSLGAAALGVAIAQRYLEPADARGEHDIIMSSETIEHVPSPPDFLATLRAALRPGGVLVLTTPDGAALSPETPAGALVPLLSPGLHLVFQTEASLRRLLAQAGFAHCAVERDGLSLVAFASDAPLALEADEAVIRTRRLDWLEARAAALPAGSDVFLGFVGRCFFDSVNAGELDRAERLWRVLAPACAQQFGIDLDDADPVPAAAPEAGLEALGHVMPLNLGCLLFARAMQRMAAGAARPDVEQTLRAAAQAADALRRALGELAMEDGLTEDVGWVARAEAALCAVARAPADGVAALRALPPAPGDAADARRRDFVRRGFVALAASGQWTEAGMLADAADMRADFADGTADAALSRAGLDALCCLGLLDLQRGEPARAAVLLARVRRALGAPTGEAASLFWLALENEARAIAVRDGAAGARRAVQAAIAEAGCAPDCVPPSVRAAWGP